MVNASNRSGAFSGLAGACIMRVLRQSLGPVLLYLAPAVQAAQNGTQRVTFDVVSKVKVFTGTSQLTVDAVSGCHSADGIGQVQSR